MQIRRAVDADLPQLLAIHNHNIEHSTAIWTDTLATLGERSAWLRAHRAPGQLAIVAVEGEGGRGSAAAADSDGAAARRETRETVLGYATYGPWRAKEGYRFTVENSVYVRHDRTGEGLGQALMEALIADAKQAGMHAMIAAIEAGNVGSVRLHERLGFDDCGVIPEVGFKFGRWLDLRHMRLALS